MINNLEEMSLDGFQIVKKEMFQHLPSSKNPTCTIWPTRISFSRSALVALNFCECIRMEVNPTTKCLLVCPTLSNDRDSIRWIKGTKDQSVKNLESKQFGEQIYNAWELDPEFNYRTIGRLVSARNKIMLLFDFNEAMMWKSKPRVVNNE